MRMHVICKLNKIKPHTDCFMQLRKSFERAKETPKETTEKFSDIFSDKKNVLPYFRKISFCIFR